jgi:hypothetical protein
MWTVIGPMRYIPPQFQKNQSIGPRGHSQTIAQLSTGMVEQVVDVVGFGFPQHMLGLADQALAKYGQGFRRHFIWAAGKTNRHLIDEDAPGAVVNSQFKACCHQPHGVCGTARKSRSDSVGQALGTMCCIRPGAP